MQKNNSSILRINKTNCLFFALKIYYRRKLKGKHGYIISRRSYYGWFPHFMYARIRKCGKCQIVGYVPLNPKHKRIPPPMFKGRVKWGD